MSVARAGRQDAEVADVLGLAAVRLEGARGLAPARGRRLDQFGPDRAQRDDGREGEQLPHFE